MIGQKAIYLNKEVTITGYVEWGSPREIKFVWIKFDDGEEMKVRAKSVQILR